MRVCFLGKKYKKFVRLTIKAADNLWALAKGKKPDHDPAKVIQAIRDIRPSFKSRDNAPYDSVVYLADLAIESADALEALSKGKNPSRDPRVINQAIYAMRPYVGLGI